MARRSLFLFVLLLYAPICGAAPPAAAPLPPDGLYEMISPLLGVAVGRLRASDTGKLARWLELRCSGRACTADFLPERRMRWTLAYGAHGLEAKTTLIRGKPWTVSRFHYGPEGRILRKTVTGPGVIGTLAYRYRTDARGRIVLRRRIASPPKGGPAFPKEVVRVRYTRAGAEVRTKVDGLLMRIDRYDPKGRLLRTDLGRPAGRPSGATLSYRRRPDGSLLGVMRKLPDRKRSPAAHGAPDPSIRSMHLAILPTTLERHEALMLLGQPVTHSEDRKAEHPTLEDNYAKDCWLNQMSSLVYDAAGLLRRGETGCICGLCVDAALHPTAPDLRVLDRHWTAGPWVRLDGRVDVTADHPIWTPAGPRAAGSLRAGDRVLAAGGGTRTLRSVEPLPPGPLRLGVNLRTASGRFEAGGFVFASEQPRPCPSPPKHGLAPNQDFDKIRP